MYWIVVGIVSALLVVALALPVYGNLVDWARAGFFIPAYVHVIGLGILVAFWLHAIAVYGSVDPIARDPILWLFGLSPYCLYACFGDHQGRHMRRCESRVARRGTMREALPLLIEEIQPYKTCSRDELVAMLWRNSSKTITSSSGQRYRLELNVVPSTYSWGGGNPTLFDRLAEEVKEGGAIKVVGALVGLDRGFLLYHPRACLSFQMDSRGRIFADHTVLADAVA